MTRPWKLVDYYTATEIKDNLKNVYKRFSETALYSFCKMSCSNKEKFPIWSTESFLSHQWSIRAILGISPGEKLC